MDHENDPGWKYLRRTREQILEDQSRPYDTKKDVWIPDEEEGYVAAQIKSASGDSTVVTITGGTEKTVKTEMVQEMNPPKFEKCEDMSNLTFLNDASVLYVLRARYSAMLIYTYSGLFCVVINPYKRLPIYTDSVARMFMGKRRTEMPPHLFAVSDEAYRNMLQNSENQSMLITGESGAGKTENTKKVISYFASVGASQAELERGAKPVEETEKKVTLEDQIVQTNPVLEAFGNAKTVRNNNSSRFGKFIRIHFNKVGRVASCDIEHYLLEKSRVIRQAPGERCYHIFYQLFSGYKPELQKQLLLDKPTADYWFIAQAELLIDGIDDKEEHKLTDDAFRVLNFSDREIQECYQLVAALMHMGNMKFKQRPREEQAEADGIDDAEKASKMYGIDQEEFMKALLRPRVKVGTEWVNKGQNLEQVNWSVGAMAKGLYSRMFNWLVVKCNKTLAQEGFKKEFFIGVLDIAGFEIFDFNSFEQLWINFVNEKLQQFFNHHMFVLEQEEYAREGIQWTFIDFGLDLQACIELIEKPMGIIAMLDEECIVPKASDQTLAQKLLEQHLGKHPNFEKPKPPKGKQAEAHFAMRHYAGTVRYNVLNWLEKNKDPLNDTVVQVMKNSKENALLVELWGDYTTQEEAAAAAAKNKGTGRGKKKGKSGSFMTVSMLYRESLNNLMNMLNLTHPHFIRCIIPNEKKQSGLIDAALVLNQLTCNGVLEGIRICRKGFPNRTMHLDFVQRYAILAADEAKSNPADPKKTVDAMLGRLVKQKDLTDEQFKVGLTKVFFKAGVVAHIEDLRDKRLSTLITAFQSVCRWYYTLINTKRLREQLELNALIQRNIRSWMELQNWSWFRLYGRVLPLLAKGKEEEQLEKLTEELTTAKETLVKEAELRKRLEEETVKMKAEREDLFKAVEKTKGKSQETQERLNGLTAAKEQLHATIEQVNSQLVRAEEQTASMAAQKKKVEQECENLKRNVNDMDLALKKAEAEKNTKENQIRAVMDELHKQEMTLQKLEREMKNQEEMNKKFLEDLQSEEERSNSEQQLRKKLQDALENVESELERERHIRSESERNKRKLEGELRIAHENLDELSKQRQDAENSLRRKEADFYAISVKFEDAQSNAAKLQRQLKENDARIKELEAEVENERQARARSERSKTELQQEIDELQEQLGHQGGATMSQMDLNKKKDNELAKLRRELDQLNMNFESQSQALKKKGQDLTLELTEQIEQVMRMRNRADKERAALQKQLDEANYTLDDEAKQRVEFERHAKAFEAQLVELRMKNEEQQRQIHDIGNQKSRLQSENGELCRAVEELEANITATTRLKAQYAAQAEEFKRMAADEIREKQSLNILSKNLDHELMSIRDSLEEEIASKSDLIRQLSREQAEIQQWRSRYESEGMVSADDADELRRKQIAQIAELQNDLDSATARLNNLEKTKARLANEADAARTEADILGQQAAQFEKKQRAFDKIVEEWRHKGDDLQNELDAAQREARNQSMEAHRLRTNQDSLTEQVEGLRRENKVLAQEVRDLQESLNEGGRNVHELQKAQRRLEVEKDELQHALDEAEAALEQEESKVLRSQVEMNQIRAEIEKRLQEKEEEFENVRKNHARAMDSMQANLEQETKAKAELARLKKKLDADISELEIAHDHAGRANQDAQRNIQRYGDQVRELQKVIDEEQRKREEFRENYITTEKKLVTAKQEQEELVTNIEALQRAKKQLEADLNDLQIANNDLLSENQILASTKSKLDAEFALLRSDVSEATSEVDAAMNRGKIAAAEASRLAEELRHEQDRSNQIDRVRKALEFQCKNLVNALSNYDEKSFLARKDMNQRVDEAEAAALKGGAKIVAKLEETLKRIESELEGEQRRHADAAKNLGKADRRAREILFQLDEEKKNYNKLCDLVEKLQTKIKQQRRQIEEAEESANVNLAKFRQIQSALETAEERADTAETSLVRMRSRSHVMKSNTMA
ncbi:CRE-MYO-2 protein [Aphelenchoides fujianensis]|nr:CRE-MYO-2 protein [Aphelenchoides fujianensis]